MMTGLNLPEGMDLRSEFPIREQFVFLNHAAVSPIPACTQAAITEFARDAAEEGPANYPTWLHGMALARGAAAQLLNCQADDVCFVKSTTHGLLIVANSLDWKPGDNVVGLAHEFPANVHPWRNLSARGVEFRMVPERPDFSFHIDDIAARIDARTRLLAVSWVEYSTGFRNDIAALAELCRSRNVLLCVDAIQGLGALPFDVSRTPVDFLSADGHKWLLAPEGCGILYVRRERIAEMNNSMAGWCGLANPSDYGDYAQPLRPDARRFEEGSHNLMAITALGASMRLLLDCGMGYVTQQVELLTGRLIDGLLARGYEVATPREFARRAGIVSFRKDGVDPAQLQQDLAGRRIVVAARRGFVRAAPHFYNDEGEIDLLLAALP